MRITFVVRSLALGGAERQLGLIASGLSRRGHAVTILTLYDGGELVASVLESGVTVVSARKGGRWSLLGFFFRFLSLCRQSQPDVLCGWMPFENILCLIASRVGRRVPLVWALRASSLDLGRYDLGTRALYWMQRRLINRPDLVLSNSQAGLQAQGLEVGSPRAVIVDNGIDIERFSLNPQRRAAVRRELGVAESTILVGIIGRLDPMKDHETFLRSARLVWEQLSDVRFLVVGSGSQDVEKGLRQLATKLGLDGCTQWLPKTNDVVAVLNAIDVLVSSSSYGEGVQNVLLEAMACGVPVVATDVGDARRAVSPWDVIVEPRNPRALAEAVLKQVRENGADRSRARREHVRIKFSIENAVLRAEEAIMCALSGRPAGGKEAPNSPSAGGFRSSRARRHVE